MKLVSSFALATLVCVAAPAAAQDSGRRCVDGYLFDADNTPLDYPGTRIQGRCVRGYVDGYDTPVIVILPLESIPVATRPEPSYPRSDYDYSERNSYNNSYSSRFVYNSTVNRYTTRVDNRGGNAQNLLPPGYGGNAYSGNRGSRPYNFSDSYSNSRYGGYGGNRSYNDNNRRHNYTDDRRGYRTVERRYDRGNVEVERRQFRNDDRGGWNRGGNDRPPRQHNDRPRHERHRR